MVEFKVGDFVKRILYINGKKIMCVFIIKEIMFEYPYITAYHCEDVITKEKHNFWSSDLQISNIEEAFIYGL